jgi:hypothetical protein
MSVLTEIPVSQGLAVGSVVVQDWFDLAPAPGGHTRRAVQPDGVN